MASPPLIRCVALSRELQAAEAGRVLLHPVSFELLPGEVLAVIGPSGAGKSTLLRLINRLDEATSGTVFVGGEDYRSVHPRVLRRRIGMVMQRAWLFPATVAENIAFGPAQHGLTPGMERIDAMLTRVGLGGYANRDALTLSGGEAQRVAILRALANDPEVLLLDEPTSALDENSRSGVEQLLASLIRERHLACLWVTHSPEQARAMADRILVLEAGRLKAIGTPEEILPQPAAREALHD